MADLKISQLTLKSPAGGTEEVPVNDGGTTKKITASSIAALANPVLGYAIVQTDASTGASDPVTDTVISGMTTTFSVSATTIVRVDFSVIKSGAHQDRYSIYDNAVKLAPQDGINGAWYDYSFGEASGWGLTVVAYGSLASGSHTIDVRENAALSTASVTFKERFLVVTKIG